MNENSDWFKNGEKEKLIFFAAKMKKRKEK